MFKSSTSNLILPTIVVFLCLIFSLLPIYIDEKANYTLTFNMLALTISLSGWFVNSQYSAEINRRKHFFETIQMLSKPLLLELSLLRSNLSKFNVISFDLGRLTLNHESKFSELCCSVKVTFELENFRHVFQYADDAKKILNDEYDDLYSCLKGINSSDNSDSAIEAFKEKLFCYSAHIYDLENIIKNFVGYQITNKTIPIRSNNARSLEHELIDIGKLKNREEIYIINS